MKLRKLLALVMMGIIGLSLLAGCGKSEDTAQQPAADTSWDQVKEAGKLVVGLDDAYPPMGFRDENNNLVGFDIDMGAEIEKRLGIKIEWQPTNWDGVIGSLQAKKFDVIISGMTITDERKKEIAFSDPYVKAGQVIVVKSNNDTIKSADDLKGKVVATQLGSSAQSIVEGMTDVKDKKFYNAFPEAFNDLEIGRIDALIADATLAPHYMTQKEGAYKVVGTISEEFMGIGMRQEDVQLREQLNKVIQEMKADGTLKKISEKWFGYDVTNF